MTFFFHRRIFPRAASVFLGAVTLAFPALMPAQQAAPASAGSEVPAASPGAASFSFEIGHAARAGAIYTVDATQPATSKLTGQRIRLKIVETAGADTNTRFYSFATGRHKTVAQIDAILSEVFGRFLSGLTPPPQGQEIGKIGDTRYGGEVRFVNVPSNQLRFDNLTPGEPVRSSFYSHADIEALQAAITGAPPNHQ